MTNPRLATLLVARCLVWTSFVIAAPAHSGGLTLRADDAPVNTPWTEPATLAVTRQDGGSMSFRVERDRFISWPPARTG
jgi:hypothetical protein